MWSGVCGVPWEVASVVSEAAAFDSSPRQFGYVLTNQVFRSYHRSKCHLFLAQITSRRLFLIHLRVVAALMVQLSQVLRAFVVPLSHYKLSWSHHEVVNELSLVIKSCHESSRVVTESSWNCLLLVIVQAIHFQNFQIIFFCFF